MASQITGVSIVCRLFRVDKNEKNKTKQKNIKGPRHWPLWGESTGHRWIPLTKGQ